MEQYIHSEYTDERVFQVNGQVNWGKSRFEWLSWFCIDYMWWERVPWFYDSVGKKLRRVLHLIKGNANLRLWPRVTEVLENLKKSVNCKGDSPWTILKHRTKSWIKRRVLKTGVLVFEDARSKLILHSQEGVYSESSLDWFYGVIQMDQWGRPDRGRIF